MKKSPDKNSSKMISYLSKLGEQTDKKKEITDPPFHDVENNGRSSKNTEGRPRSPPPYSSIETFLDINQELKGWTIDLCSEELKQQYMHCSDTLKIALPPSTQAKIHRVENLHVRAVLKKMEISPDRPRMQEIEAQELFDSPHFRKKRILLFGPSGVGKTTEIKMWLALWCQKNEGPLKKFTLVFYIDGLKVEKGSGLGEAIKTQCLSANKSFTPEVIENLCKECADEILVVLDHYTKWNRTDQPSSQRNTSTLEDMVLLQEFRHLTVLVALKSGGIGDFREVYGNYDHVKVEGIDTTLVATYIDKVFEERKDFGLMVKEYIEKTDLLRDMVASPVLLCIMCQILKWIDIPTSLGELKTSSALIEKSIDYVMRHADPSTNTEPNEHSASGPTSLRSNIIFLNQTKPTLSKDLMIKYLSVVAFNCYWKEGKQEELHLCERDFDVCGDLKTDVLKEGIRRGLLVKSGQEEFIPSSSVASEGKIYRFLNVPFQQRLAAKRFSELLNGNDEDKQSFHTSLQKIGSIEDAFSFRNLMQFSCAESVDAARTIVSHLVDLTLASANDSGLIEKEGEGVIWQADDGLYQYMVEFILALNYESRSDGRLNDVLHPLVKRLQIMSPSDILTRSLIYFLEHVVDPHAPPRKEFKIEVLDIPRKIQDSLPKQNNIDYEYEENATVSIEMGGLEDPSVGGACSQPTLTPVRIRKLTIKVDGKTRGNVTPADDLTQLHKHLLRPLSESGAGAGRKHIPRREIKEIKQSEYEVCHSDLISSGGYGDVYEGNWNGNKVAVKRVKCVEDKMADTLVREIKINALVEHKNIVYLYAYSKHKQGKRTEYLCFDLILQLIEGSTLKDALFGKKWEYLDSLLGKLSVASKVSGAISHIHSKKCTHSDLKSDNILIRKLDNEPFVCDLGLAHGLTHSAITDLTSGRRGGVKKWSPPESCERGFKATPEGDIWSLACLFLELFTGRHVWEDENGEELSDREIHNRLCGDDFVPDTISTLDNPMIKKALLSCFTREPKERPSAEDLTKTFDEVLSTVSELLIDLD